MDKQQQKGVNFALGRLVGSEEQDSVQCLIKGTVPPWLKGEVTRNGPGEFEVGPDKFVHLFDGHAFIHKFSIVDGQVTYTAKFVKSEMFLTNHEHDRILIGGFGSKSYPDPCKNIFSRFFTVLTSSPKPDNCNVNIATLGNAHYAITDGGLAYRIDPETLDTKQMVDMVEILNVPMSSAHPHYDENGDYYNFATSFGRKSFYNVVKIPSSSMNKEDPLQDLQIHAKIPVDTPLSPTYHHSFVLTENFIVFHDQPYRVHIPKLLWKMRSWQAMSEALQVDETRESVFHVVHKKSGESLPIKFAAKGEFCFHSVNGFETCSNGKRFLVIDMCCVENFNMNGGMVILENLKNADEKDSILTSIKRFVLPLDIGEDICKGNNLVTIDGCKAEAVVRDDNSVFLNPDTLLPEEAQFGSLELPRINYKYNGKKYRYFYCLSAFDKDGGSHLYKCDIETKQGSIWKEQDCIASEPVFVERPGAVDEDDGIILSTVINRDPNNPVFLLILDAKTFQEIARAEVTTNLSMSFHGLFNSYM